MVCRLVGYAVRVTSRRCRPARAAHARSACSTKQRKRSMSLSLVTVTCSSALPASVTPIALQPATCITTYLISFRWLRKSCTQQLVNGSASTGLQKRAQLSVPGHSLRNASLRTWLPTKHRWVAYVNRLCYDRRVTTDLLAVGLAMHPLGPSRDAPWAHVLAEGRHCV